MTANRDWIETSKPATIVLSGAESVMTPASEMRIGGNKMAVVRVKGRAHQSSTHNPMRPSYAQPVLAAFHGFHSPVGLILGLGLIALVVYVAVRLANSSSPVPAKAKDKTEG